MKDCDVAGIAAISGNIKRDKTAPQFLLDIRFPPSSEIIRPLFKAVASLRF